MRSRRAFRPCVEFMPRLALLSGGPTDGDIDFMAPVTVNPENYQTGYIAPMDPVTIPTGPADPETYVGDDPSNGVTSDPVLVA